jgi:hypothetical protein
MKKLFTLFCLGLIFYSSIYAQTITVAPTSFELNFTADGQEATHSTITNNSTTGRTLRWIRYVNDAPAAWTTTVCDLNNCYSASTATMAFYLDAGASGLLDVTLTPHDVAGTGTYEIFVYDVNDSANVNGMVTIAADIESATGISDPAESGISIFPIPAKDMLTIGFDPAKNINRIEVYNVVGQKLKTAPVTPGSKSVVVPVSDLKKGVYFVRVYGNGKEIVTKTFTKE